MNATTITIGIGEAIAIVIGLGIPIISGFLAVWRASASAHKEIIGRLGTLETDMTTVKTEVTAVKTDVATLKTGMAVANTNLDWLKHYARAGQPPPDKE